MVTGVHADPLVVRLVYWLAYVVAARTPPVFMLTVWPPPDRVFPRKNPSRASTVNAVLPA